MSFSVRLPEDRPYIKYYLLCFIYGGLLMYFEITTAKMIVPFYGASVKVWATVLCGVLTGLSIGYYLGGRIDKRDALGISSLIAGVYIFIMPLVTPPLFELFYSIGNNIGLVLSGFVLCLLPSIFFGMLSPVLVNVLCKDVEDTGSVVGWIFTISTAGGVLMAIISGFWLIPILGVRISCFVIGVLMLLVSIGFTLTLSGTRYLLTLATVLMFIGITVTVGYGTIRKQPDFIKYSRVGFYGELIVADLLHEKNGKEVKARLLLNNRIAQSFINLETGLSEWRYIHYLDLLSSIKPYGSRVLMLGLAGGSLVNEMIDMGFEVDAVDIDERVYKIALDYFNLSPKCRFFVDDARRFLNSTRSKYDIVVIDLFSAESQPFHVFTLEAFKKIRQILNDDGIVLINFHEHVFGNKGKGLRSVYKTMIEAGFLMNYLNTSETDEDRNNILIGSNRMIDWQVAGLRKRSIYQQRGINLPIRLKTINQQMLAQDYILTDDKPVFEVINEEAFRDWREHAIENYLLGLNKMGFPIF
ncbi:MAG: fused MFS/spermidine synthase [Thermodesulfovibrionales bacterium]